MTNIHEIDKKKGIVFIVKSRMILKGLNMRSWAIKNGFKYTSVNMVVLGYLGKLGKVDNVSGAIRAALIADGFWPENEQVDK